LIKNNKLSEAQSVNMNNQVVNWTSVQQTPEFATFSHQVHELQNSFFENTTSDYITAVFINIFNIMIIHLHFLLGPPNSEIRRKMYNIHKYMIAGELYSLADIQHGILRANPKNSLSRTRQIRGGDKRRAYVLPAMDPRIHFALLAVNIFIPCLRIFNPDTLIEDLHKCGAEFCSSKIDICLKKKEINLPKVFSHYGTDFGKSRSEMLRWIFQFLTQTKRNELVELLEKPSFICLYRGERWNPISYKTKFINDLEEKQQTETETERKLQEKEKLLRRKSRSLTHGNRLQSATSTNKNKDSSTLALKKSLKLTSLNSNTQILTIISDLFKTVPECLDQTFVVAVLDILRKISKKLSFNDWQKSSAMGGNSNSSADKTPMMLKPHQYSIVQNYCLSPESQQVFSQHLKELFNLCYTIEKEMNKFLDFMEISSFSQSNDINELLSEMSNDLQSQINQLKSTHDLVSNTKVTLIATIDYFNVSLSSKSQLPSSSSEENLLSNILQELAIDENPSAANNPLTATSTKSSSSSSLIHVSLQQQSKQKQQHMKHLTEKINSIQNQIENCKDIDSLIILSKKVKKIGQWIALYDDHCTGRYSPRSIIKSSC